MAREPVRAGGEQTAPTEQAADHQHSEPGAAHPCREAVAERSPTDGAPAVPSPTGAAEQSTGPEPGLQPPVASVPFHREILRGQYRLSPEWEPWSPSVPRDRYLPAGHGG